MMSSRYLPAACALLAIALVPTLIHSYSPAPAPPEPVATAIPAQLAGYVSRPSSRNATWGQRRFNTDDWVERDYVGPSGERVTLTVVRTFDAKSIYHHPELAVAYGTSFVDETVSRSPEWHDVPVHVLTPAPGVGAAAAYVLHYDGRFIDNPILFQIRTAGELLFSRRKPMTLLFALAREESPRRAPGESATLVVLRAAGQSLEPTTAPR
jgi:hypothetical protein